MEFTILWKAEVISLLKMKGEVGTPDKLFILNDMGNWRYWIGKQKAVSDTSQNMETAVALILLNHSGHAHLFGMEKFSWFEILFVKSVIEMGMLVFSNRWNWL